MGGACSSDNLDGVRAAIVARLRVRQPEIEEVIFANLRTIAPDPIGDRSPEYTTGLSIAVKEGVNYSLSVIEYGEIWPGPIPSVVIDQARRAARSGVSVETVMRRVTIAERLVKKFATEESDHLSAGILDLALSALGAAIDRLMIALAEEYNSEHEKVAHSSDWRRLTTVRTLLSNGSCGTTELAELGYDLDAWHLGLIVIGSHTEDFLNKLMSNSRCSLLPVVYEGLTWAWLGNEQRLSVAEIERLFSAHCPEDIVLAIGEPGKGIDGWRCTHREAQVALTVARRRSQRFTRCADVLPEAAVLTNEIMAQLLVRTYISPLNNLRKGGQAARDTLRVYFAHDRHISSTAKTLRVVRRTVENHLREIEEALGRPLHHACLTKLEIALRLEEFGYTGEIDDFRSM
jgi:hypothetical protein